ncbi:MAG: hypothetical protein WBN92_04225, partial [Terriglobia bacterium]
MSISFEGLLAGVHVSPSNPFTLATGQSQQVTLTADISAPAGGATVTIRGTSGTISHTYLFVVQVYSPLPYKVSVTPATLSLTPASIGTVQVSAAAGPGTTLRMAEHTPSLNACGVDFDYREYGLMTSDHPVKLGVRASAVAQPVQNVPIIITASDFASGQTSVAVVILSITVSFPQVTTPTRSTFVRTDENVKGAVYDAARKLVFVTLQDTNQVRVLSSIDGHLVATIPVEQPFGIDETPDGTAVLVGGYSPNIAVINPDLLEVTRLVPAPRLSTPGISVDFLFPQYLVAVSSGSVLILGRHGYSSMTYVYLWDQMTDQMTAIKFPDLFFPSELHRTADGSTAFVTWSGPSGGVFTFFDASKNRFSPPVSGGRFNALRPDGRQFAGWLDQGGVGFFDSQGNLVGSIPWLGGSSNMIYSADGKRLYAFGGFGPTLVNEVAVLDTQNFTLLGLVPNLGVGNTPLAIDETGMIFGASSRGVAFLDVRSPGTYALPLPGQFTVVPQLVNQSAPMAVNLNISGLMDQAKNYNIFIGAPPASPHTLIGTNISDPSSYVVQMLVPPSPRAGPANVTL